MEREHHAKHPIIISILDEQRLTYEREVQNAIQKREAAEVSF